MTPVRTSRRRLRWIIPAVVLIAIVGLAAFWVTRDSAEERAATLSRQARSELAAGNYAQAEASALRALELNPTLREAAYMAAECAVSQRKYEQAVAHASLLRDAEPEWQLRAESLIADLEHHRLQRLSRAEAAYRRVIDIDEGNPDANRELAILLGTCARRTEAVPCVIRLIRAGETTDLLILLSRDSGMINDQQLLAAATKADPSDPAPLLGLAWHASENDQHAEARQLLEEAIRLDPHFAPAHLALLQLLLEQSDRSALAVRLKALPDSARDSATAWQVRAKLWEDTDARAATRCLLEAIAREPESNGVTVQLSRLLSGLGESEAAAGFSEWQGLLQQLRNKQDEVIFSGMVDGPESLLRLAESYAAVGRFWEALGWCRMALTIEGDHTEIRRMLREQEVRTADLALRLTADSARPVRDIDLTRFTLPDGFPDSTAAGAPHVVETDAPLPESLSRVTFEMGADGFEFHYFNGTMGEPSRRMFEFTGGGIGIIDFDSDTFPDVFCTQGRIWDSPEQDADHHDELLRNVRGEAFESAAGPAGISEDDFGQGVAVGDVNADGFADLFVANIGPNRLWLNNGDGTFRDATAEAGIRGDEWTTSCALADLNGDGLPDCYAVNYVRGADVFDRLCPDENGIPRMCTPLHFEAETDRIRVNNGETTFRDGTSELLNFQPAGKGLGVAVWQARPQSGLSVFVANDTTPNFFFTTAATLQPPHRADDEAVAYGLAVNNDGKSEGCMGIAVADFTGDQQDDLYVTNFLRETNTAYASSESGLFQDRTREMRGEQLSMNLLGFGTQAIDADLDGSLEIFVANGHIDDLQDAGKPFRMSPQLLATTHGLLREIPSEQLGAYFELMWRGRAVATLDWNHDLKPDVVIGHLDDPTTLLNNRTDNAGNAVTLRFMGTASTRDAIGTTLKARIGDRMLHRQLTAGDGFQASNERRITIGLNTASEIDELTIHWPSGAIQRFEHLAADSAWIAVEGRPLLAEPH